MPSLWSPDKPEGDELAFWLSDRGAFLCGLRVVAGIHYRGWHWNMGGGSEEIKEARLLKAGSKPKLTIAMKTMT